MNLDKDFYRVKEICSMLGISAATLRNWERAGTVPPLARISKRYVGYSRDTLANLRKRFATCATC